MPSLPSPPLLPLFHDIPLVDRSCYSKQSFDGVALVNTSLSLVVRTPHCGAERRRLLPSVVGIALLVHHRKREGEPKGSALISGREWDFGERPQKEKCQQ